MKYSWFEGPNWDGFYFPDFAGKTEVWYPDKGIRQFFGLLFDRGNYGAGHSGDEYGNCLVYVRLPWFSAHWVYPTGHRQTDVELPLTSDPGECRSWVTRYISRDLWLEEYKAWKDGHGAS